MRPWVRAALPASLRPGFLCNSHCPGSAAVTPQDQTGGPSSALRRERREPSWQQPETGRFAQNTSVRGAALRAGVRRNGVSPQHCR